MECSNEMKDYFKFIDKKLKQAYDIADKARKKGFDPENKVDIPIANDVADRVEKLLSVADEKILNKKLPEKIRDIAKEYSESDWRVALVISEQVAKGKFGDFGSVEKNMEMGVRAGLAEGRFVLITPHFKCRYCKKIFALHLTSDKCDPDNRKLEEVKYVWRKSVLYVRKTKRS